MRKHNHKLAECGFKEDPHHVIAVKNRYFQLIKKLSKNLT